MIITPLGLVMLALYWLFLVTAVAVGVYLGGLSKGSKEPHASQKGKK